MSSIWDETEFVESFKALHADGLSFSAMAAQLGHGLTRSALCGKARRLGLARRDSWGSNPDRQRRPRQPRPHLVSILDHDEPDDDLSLPSELPAAGIPIEQRKSLLELKPHHCRYIYGDPTSGDYFYCGGDKYAGSYCAYHHSVAHRGVAQLTDFERERRRQVRISAHRIATEAERLSG